eukprot:3298343-Alexandrium_andersonii.AAC.1
MSASLVGSEMCIRDRISRFAAAPRTSGRGPAPRWLCLPTDASSVATVSYTHLTLPTICSV